MRNQRTKPKWRVTILSNIKDESLPHTFDLPPDAYADFESVETIRLLRNAIESDGHETALLIADKTLPRMLEEYQPDICFNAAEGIAYEDLILEILYLAAGRWGLFEPRV